MRVEGKGLGGKGKGIAFWTLGPFRTLLRQECLKA